MQKKRKEKKIKAKMSTRELHDGTMAGTKEVGWGWEERSKEEGRKCRRERWWRGRKEGERREKGRSEEDGRKETREGGKEEVRGGGRNGGGRRQEKVG